MAEKRKYKLAAAISYKQENNAPIVVAKGSNLIADKIIDIAQKNDVPIHVDPDCASLLNMVDIGNEIPEELYEVVARVLSFVYSLDKGYKTKQ